MRYFVIFIILCLTIKQLVAQDNEEQRIQKLQEKIARQQQILHDLSEQIQAREQIHQNYTENLIQEYLQQQSILEGQGITAGYEKGFFVKTEDENFKIRINGHLRSHLFLYEANTITNNSFRETDTRVDFHVYLFKDWHIRIRPDFSAGNGKTVLRDAFVEYTGWDCLRIRVGSWMSIFSMEVETPPLDTLAITVAPYATTLPGRDLGFGIYGYGIPLLNSEYLSQHFMYQVDLLNGQGVDRRDNHDGKMITGIGRFFPLGRENANVFIQGSFFYTETAFTEDGAALRLAALRNHEVFGGEPNTKVEDTDDVGGNTMALDAAFRYWKDNLRIEGEAVMVRYNRNSGGQIPQRRHPLDMWGVSAGMSYFFPIGNPENNAGIEPLVKFSYTDIDDKDGDGSSLLSTNPTGTPGDVQGQSIWEIVIGAKLHANKNFRMDFNWVMYDLSRTRGLTNSDNRKGGGLIHAFVFQWGLRW